VPSPADGVPPTDEPEDEDEDEDEGTAREAGRALRGMAEPGGGAGV